MAGYFSKLFGSKSKSSGGEVETFINETLSGIIENGKFDL